MILLTRDQFRNEVFQRDNHKCVVCLKPAVDAHHIIERKLFDDGGYYLDNGVSVCEKHHLLAEQTIISCDELRRAAKITKIVLPENFQPDRKYDKWGNIVLTNGKRLKGPMFEQESVQKILKYASLLHLFEEP